MLGKFWGITIVSEGAQV